VKKRTTSLKIENNCSEEFSYSFSYFINVQESILIEKEKRDLYFPYLSNTYYQRHCELIEPLYYNCAKVIKNNVIAIKIRIPKCIICGLFLEDSEQDFIQFNKGSDDIFTCEIDPMNIKSKVFNVSASFEDFDDKMENLVNFKLD